MARWLLWLIFQGSVPGSVCVNHQNAPVVSKISIGSMGERKRELP